MWAQHEAIISRKAFVDAIGKRHVPKRIRIAGVRSEVPSDVLIYAAGTDLVLDTPCIAVPVAMEGQWGIRISVPHAALVLAASKLGRKRHISLRYVANSLIINDGAFVVPAKAKRP
ncbi:MAG: hypothetical protein ACRECV_00495 [Xanthobacteraceae bacterium]